MSLLVDNLHAVQQRIMAACARVGRPAGGVTLLAVSKTRSADEVRALSEHGVRDFGENYVQEGVAKAHALAGLNLTWHLIGPLQSNKTSDVAQCFDWVHSIDRLKIAQRLSDQRPDHLPPLNVCLQVNVSGEASKSGVDFAALPELAHTVAKLPRLRLHGLMAIPEASDEPEQLRARFAAMRSALQQLNQQGFMLDTLSLGMSADLELAIEEGSTLVRVGTAIFGAREARL